MSASNTSKTVKRPYTPTHTLSNSTSNQWATFFSSDEGYPTLIYDLNEECKVLQNIKKLLEERLILDKQYARSIQELTKKAERMPWGTHRHTMISVK